MKPFQVVMLTLPWKQLPDYPDIGSWKTNADGSPAFIGAADTGSDISNAGILLHEYIESFMCWKQGITEQAVSTFDQMWFKEEHGEDEEPGSDIRCPYRHPHLAATQFERDFVEMMGMSWEQHGLNCKNAEK